MKEQLLQAVRDLNARVRYYSSAYDTYRHALGEAPVTEVMDNRRSRIRVSLIGPALNKQINDGMDNAGAAFREATSGRPAADIQTIERIIAQLPDGSLTQGQKAQINSIIDTFSKITTGPVVQLIKELRNAL